MAIIDPYTQLRGTGALNFPTVNATALSDKYKSGIMDQYTDIASKYDQPVTYADSPVFQAGLEKWDPYSGGSIAAEIAQKTKSALGAGTAATAAPFGSGMYVPPIENTIAEYSKYLSNPETAKALGESDWATQFGHEASHLGWEYENLGKQLESISPHWKTSASNPSYAGEEQWNYMHDLMYGPRYEEDTHGRPGEKYLTTKELINPGDLSYTPYAHDVISKSGLIPEHKKAIGFGINPFEDTKAAGQWYAIQKYKNMSKAKKQAQFQEIIRKEEAAKQKAAADAAAAAAAAKQKYSGQGAQGGGGGTNIGGGQQTSSGIAGGAISHSAAKEARGDYEGWGLADGGLINFYRYGGFI